MSYLDENNIFTTGFSLQIEHFTNQIEDFNVKKKINVHIMT